MAIASLVAAAPAQADSYSIEDAVAGAQLRSEASVIVPIIYSPCGTSEALAAPSARYNEFRAALKLNRHRLDLAIAEADFDYQMSLVDISCREFTPKEAAQIGELNAAIVNSTLDRMVLYIERAVPSALPSMVEVQRLENGYRLGTLALGCLGLNHEEARKEFERIFGVRLQAVKAWAERQYGSEEPQAIETGDDQTSINVGGCRIRWRSGEAQDSRQVFEQQLQVIEARIGE